MGSIPGVAYSSYWWCVCGGGGGGQIHMKGGRHVGILGQSLPDYEYQKEGPKW